MTVIVKILIACMLCINLTFAEYPDAPHAVLSAQQGLARLFFSPRARNPQLSMACFSGYMSHSSHISETYSKRYNQCLTDAKAQRNEVDLETLSQRNQLVTESEDICKRVTVCNGNNNTLQMFNCHANAGVNNTKSTYLISNNASEYATALVERYRLIDVRHEQCYRTAERTYVDETANNYNHLQACLDGRADPRPEITTTTTTQAPAALPSSTEAPSSPPPTTTTSTTTESPQTPSTTQSTAAETNEPVTEELTNEPNEFAKLLNALK